MTDELSRLALHVVVPEPERPGRNVELRALVDGVDVVAAAFDSGPARSPQELLRPGGPLEATAEPHEVRLAEAECSEGCCGALHVMVRGDDEHVVWSGWRNTGWGSTPLAEFRFDAQQYRAELDRARADHSWEWPACTVARLLEQDLGRQVEWLERWDCRILSVRSHPWMKDLIIVLLGHPSRGSMVDGPWLQFQIELRASDADPALQARQIADRLLAGDPREMGEVCGGTREWAEQLGYRLG